jgi:ABC-type branched-subunit amino acid transport system ATPase component
MSPGPANRAAFLELAGVSAGYGPITVLDRLSLRLQPRQVLAVLGANGSGKSTVLKTIMGLTRLTAGRITMDGEDVTGLPAHRRAALGVGYVPQNQNVFADLTVADNLRMGGYLRPRALAEDLDKVYELFPQLKGRERERASNLSGGERRMLSIGLTLLMGPKVLMLDEPSSDLAPLMVDLVFQSIRDIRARLDMPVLLVEQNVDKALSLADRVTVLVRGRDALDVPVDDVDHAQLHDLFLNGSVRTDAAGAGQR